MIKYNVKCNKLESVKRTLLHGSFPISTIHILDVFSLYHLKC